VKAPKLVSSIWGIKEAVTCYRYEVGDLHDATKNIMFRGQTRWILVTQGNDARSEMSVLGMLLLEVVTTRPRIDEGVSGIAHAEA